MREKSNKGVPKREHPDPALKRLGGSFLGGNDPDSDEVVGESLEETKREGEGKIS